MNSQNLDQRRNNIRIAQLLGGLSFSIALFSLISNLREFGSSSGAEAARQMNAVVNNIGMIFLGLSIFLFLSSLSKGEKGWSWKVILSVAFTFISMAIACRSLWLKM